ncbi:NAD(P)-binding protein [Aspergillus vadensis CBS 113365]|uniref:NAD(P)-binding protein n=1 Tax=Aspergillus vadensis (strain CBS 113365 / IMI 142717 / IBT 24658) TaxID=1448311 RepID=A0A319BCB4_ASPVC|nr:NAD(P)-binding protein [Aspergillus vadensis CBS 113365]PYH70385.1 NAD(P)-binding protein [Aspergillus vadensis CBS 113365]
MPTTLVTGGTGYIALHVIKLLLEQGHKVHTTVRSVKNSTKCEPLFNLQSQYPGSLSLFEADLLKDGSFLQAMEGCDIVHHIASPFLSPSQIKDGLRECVEPALSGTRNVLESVNQCQAVWRVVLTSSVAAMYGDSMDIHSAENSTLTESHWNEASSVTNNPYYYSKVIAEREAWKIHAAQDRWDLVVLNPGLVLGPSLSSESVSGSLFMIDNMFRGNDRMGAAELYFPVVDVRDVAEAHIRVGSMPSAKGRYLIVGSEETFSMLELADMVRPVHRNPRVLPTRFLPRFIVYLAGPFVGVSIKWLARNLGVRIGVDNKRSVRELGMEYRSVESMIRDHYEAWVEREEGR